MTYFNEEKTRELLNLKKQWGFTAILGSLRKMENCDIYANDVFRHSWQQSGLGARHLDAPPPMASQAKRDRRAEVRTYAPRPSIRKRLIRHHGAASWRPWRASSRNVFQTQPSSAFC